MKRWGGGQKGEERGVGGLVPRDCVGEADGVGGGHGFAGLMAEL